LKALQKIWYKKLKDDGFVDIEEFHENPFLKNSESTYFFRRYTPEEYAEKEEYYSCARRFLYRYSFETKLDREVWHLHSEGIGYREIADRLRSRRFKCNKDSVNKIVVRLVEIMKTTSDADE